MKRLVFICATLLATAGAYADVARPFASPTVMSTATPPGVVSLGQVTLALALVLGVIFATAWAVRRMRGFGRTVTGALDVIADLPLGQKERAVLIRVGTTQVLLGVAPGRVSTLHVLAQPIDLTPPVNANSSSEQRPNFKALLMKSLGK